jgi:hypothetical protein
MIQPDARDRDAAADVGREEDPQQLGRVGAGEGAFEQLPTVLADVDADRLHGQVGGLDLHRERQHRLAAAAARQHGQQAQQSGKPPHRGRQYT